jgi:hypothetical protein
MNQGGVIFDRLCITFDRRKTVQAKEPTFLISHGEWGEIVIVCKSFKKYHRVRMSFFWVNRLFFPDVLLKSLGL